MEPGTRPTRVRQSDIVGRRIIRVDGERIYVETSQQYEDVLTAIYLDDGTVVNVDAVETDAIPVVSYGVERPRRKRPRECHGCGKPIDRYAPVHVVYCGLCGDPNPYTRRY